MSIFVNVTQQDIFKGPSFQFLAMFVAKKNLIFLAGHFFLQYKTLTMSVWKVTVLSKCNHLLLVTFILK